jgi:penicillin-binding protein 2
MRPGWAVKIFFVLAAALLLSLLSPAATISSRPATRLSRGKPGTITENPRASRKMSRMHHARVARTRTRTSRKRYYERFRTSPFADNVTEGDITTGEDPVVRRAALDALGNLNGTIVAIDPSNGRILSMVNQKLALSAGATPCSTIKVPVALAALSENLITKDTKVPLGKHWQMNLTDALAHSNNAYFEALGRRLGFDKYSYYAHQFGLGELAGWNLQGEHLGTFPNEPLADKFGGVGKMCSFGESISMTPLQLGAIMAAVANGGTLYYLQHPTTVDEAVNFVPRVKRHLDIAPVLSELLPGMAGAVKFGTARSLRVNFSEEEVLGKTGTCSNNAGTRYGWFASFANTEYGRIVTVVFLQGNRAVYGPRAAEITGHFYRNLYDHSFFASKPLAPIASSSTANGSASQ